MVVKDFSEQAPARDYVDIALLTSNTCFDRAVGTYFPAHHATEEGREINEESSLGGPWLQRWMSEFIIKYSDPREDLLAEESAVTGTRVDTSEMGKDGILRGCDRGIGKIRHSYGGSYKNAAKMASMVENWRQDVANYVYSEDLQEFSEFLQSYGLKFDDTEITKFARQGFSPNALASISNDGTTVTASFNLYQKVVEISKEYEAKGYHLDPETVLREIIKHEIVAHKHGLEGDIDGEEHLEALMAAYAEKKMNEATDLETRAQYRAVMKLHVDRHEDVKNNPAYIARSSIFNQYFAEAIGKGKSTKAAKKYAASKTSEYFSKNSKSVKTEEESAESEEGSSGNKSGSNKRGSNKSGKSADSENDEGGEGEDGDGGGDSGE